MADKQKLNPYRAPSSNFAESDRILAVARECQLKSLSILTLGIMAGANLQFADNGNRGSMILIVFAIGWSLLTMILLKNNVMSLGEKSL